MSTNTCRSHPVQGRGLRKVHDLQLAVPMVLAEIRAQKAADKVARALVIVPNSATDSAVQRDAALVLLRATDSLATSCVDQAPIFSANGLKCVVSVPARVVNTLECVALVQDAAAIDSQCEDMVHRAANMGAAITLNRIETSIGNSLKVAAHAAMALVITEIEKVAGTMAIAVACVAPATVENGLQCAAKAHHATATAHDSAVPMVRREMASVIGQKVMKTAVLAAMAKAAALIAPMARHLKVVLSAANAPDVVVMAPVAMATVPVRHAMAKVADSVALVVPVVRPQAMAPERVAMVPVATAVPTAMAAAAHHLATATVMMIAVLPSPTRMTTTKVTKIKPKKKRLYKLSR